MFLLKHKAHRLILLERCQKFETGIFINQLNQTFSCVVEFEIFLCDKYLTKRAHQFIVLKLRSGPLRFLSQTIEDLRDLPVILCLKQAGLVLLKEFIGHYLNYIY